MQKKNNHNNIDQDRKLFISWSKEKSKAIAEKLQEFIKYVSTDFNAFFSTKNLDRGKRLISSLEREMSNSYGALFVITDENTKSEWLHFELGFLARKKDIQCIPILFGVNKKNLSDLFSDRLFIEFNKETFKSTFIKLHKELLQVRKADIDIVEERFENKWDKFEADINLIIESKNSDANQIVKQLEIDEIASNKTFGFVSTVPPEKFHQLRRNILEKDSSSIILAGSSLGEAFFGASETDDHLGKQIDRIIKNKLTDKNSTLKFLKIFLSDPKVFDEPIREGLADLSDTPAKRIGTTLNTLTELFKFDINTDIEIKLFFIPLFQLDHSVITDDFIISRNTMLWVGKKNSTSEIDKFKGTFLFGEKSNSKISLYNSYKKYLETLEDSSTLIDLEIESTIFKANEVVSKSTKIHYDFRKEIKEINKSQIKIYKLYESQLKSFLRSTWMPEFSNIFKEKGYIKQSDIAKVQNLPSNTTLILKETPLIKNDKTQSILLPYLNETEKLLNKIVKKYDKNGFAEVLPSFDLGMPNNIQRLSGGFATGSVVLWQCGTPIIPIDATVNVCSSSVYRVNKDLTSKLTESFFKELIISSNKKGYLYNFEASNHFIIFGKDEVSSNYYLVLHSSAKEFKYNALGLYPYDKCWYANKIKTVYNENRDRYLRYIKDDDAVQFYKTAKTLNGFNTEVHNWFAEKIANDDTHTIIDGTTHHHYGMPSSYSIIIGSFLVDDNVEVPIFSNRGKRIAVVVAKSNNVKINIQGKAKNIIPHGWGQQLLDESVERIELVSTKSDNILNSIKIGKISNEIRAQQSFKDIATVRDFETQTEFLNSLGNGSNLEIKFEITPIIAVDKDGYHKFSNE